jgi:chitinase
VSSRTPLLLLALFAAGCGDEAFSVIERTPMSPSQPDGGGPGLPPGTQLAVYWGQDLFGSTNPDMTLWEKPLADVCTGTPYDFVVLAYVTSVASGSDGSYTAFAQNFANHCTLGTPLPGAPMLSRCDDIAAGIIACHSAHKKVVITVGPADPGLQSDANGSVGEQAAQSMWDLYLGGSGSIRPFPDQSPSERVIVDGVNLEFTPMPSSSAGQIRFAGRLHELMNASGGTYYLTATPQCGYPDPLGPGMGTVIGDNPVAFDALLVEFYYTSSCIYSASNPNGFLDRLQSWATLMRNGRPKILVGLPLASTQPGYVDRPSLPALVNAARNSAAFDGLVLRDESYDQNSADSSGLTYGEYARPLLP